MNLPFCYGRISRILTYGGCLVLHQFRQRSYGNLESFHVESGHVVLAASFVTVVDDVFTDVVLRCRFLVEVGRSAAGTGKIQE